MRSVLSPRFDPLAEAYFPKPAPNLDTSGSRASATCYSHAEPHFSDALGDRGRENR